MCKTFVDEIIESNDNTIIKQYLIRLKNILINFVHKPSQLVEIYGCYRHFGHPTIDELVGVKKMLSHTRENIVIDKNSVKIMSGALKRNFVIQFIIKNHRWPNCSLPEEAKVSDDFRKLLTVQPLSFQCYNDQDKLKMWNKVIFYKEFDYNDFPDFTELLSDTSIAPYKENWLTIYHRDLMNIYVDKNTYIVTNPANNKNIGKFHASSLKKYYSKTSDNSSI